MRRGALALAVAASVGLLSAGAVAAASRLEAPRLSGLLGLVDFFEQASGGAGLLAPAAWWPALHPFLRLDPRLHESLATHGVSPDGPLLLSFHRGGVLSCIQLSDREAYRELETRGLSALGVLDRVDEVASRALREGRTVAASVVSRRRACAVHGGPGVQRLLPRARALAARAPARRRGAGPLVIEGQRLEAALSASAGRLEARGRWGGAQIALRGAGITPYGELPEAALAVRARLQPAALRAELRSRLRRAASLCEGCDPRRLPVLLSALVAELTGQVLWVVTELDTEGRLRDPRRRPSAVRQAALAQLRNPGRARARLARAARGAGLTELEGGVRLALAGGFVDLEIVGPHLVISNDAAARALALSAVAEAPLKMAHGLQWRVSPGLAASALRRVSPLELLTAADLAPLLLARAELMALLGRTEALTGTADPAGRDRLRFWASWQLEPETPRGP